MPFSVGVSEEEKHRDIDKTLSVGDSSNILYRSRSVHILLRKMDAFDL
jgi:hypothetical protein